MAPRSVPHLLCYLTGTKPAPGPLVPPSGGGSPKHTTEGPEGNQVGAKPR